MRNQGEIATPTAMPPAMRAQHEAARDRAEVEHRLVLEPGAVRDLKDEIAADHEHQLPAGGERQRERRGGQPDAAEHRRARADLAGRDRPVAFARVVTVAFHVERVVEEIGTARGEAEAHERDEGPERGLRVREEPGRSGGRDDEHVLRPLLGAGEAQERGRSMLDYHEFPARNLDAHAGASVRAKWCVCTSWSVLLRARGARARARSRGAPSCPSARPTAAAPRGIRASPPPRTRRRRRS